MNNRLRQIIKNCLPYGFVISRRRNNFLKDYDAWKNAGNKNITFNTTCHFKNFVTIDGYGFSGSSAVMDLLREYSNCTVWATKPSFTKNTFHDTANGIFGEFDICRHTGGLLFLEYLMRPEAWVNDFWADAAVKDFINVAYYSDVYQQYPETRPIFFSFFDTIIYLRKKSDLPLMNIWRNNFQEDKDCFILQRMTQGEYQVLCRHFLYTLFNTLFKDVKNEDTLVLDHIFGDCGNDMARFEPYLPGIKRIIVDRDVRAVYVHACKKNIRWIAHDSIEDFAKWERKMHYKDGVCDKLTTLEIQFEHLVNNYEKDVTKIERFLNISPEQHIYPRQVFDPDISSKNVSAWKQEKVYANDCEKLQKIMPEYCYGE